MTVRPSFKPTGNDIADQAFLDFTDAIDIALRKASAVALSISDEDTRYALLDMLDDYLETQANFNRGLRMKQLMDEARYNDEEIELTPEEQKQVDELVAAYFAEFGREDAEKKSRKKRTKKNAGAKANNAKKKTKANGEATG